MGGKGWRTGWDLRNRSTDQETLPALESIRWPWHDGLCQQRGGSSSSSSFCLSQLCRQALCWGWFNRGYTRRFPGICSRIPPYPMPQQWPSVGCVPGSASRAGQRLRISSENMKSIGKKQREKPSCSKIGTINILCHYSNSFLSM